MSNYNNYRSKLILNMVNNSKNSSDSGQVCDQDATPDSTLCLQLSQCQEPYIETPVYMDLNVITIESEAATYECPDTKKICDHVQGCDQDATHDSNLCLQLGQCQDPDIETPVMDLDVITTASKQIDVDSVDPETKSSNRGKLIACIVAGLFFILMPLLLIAIDPMFIIGKYNFRLENGTILQEVLSEELECGRFQVYLFNITNAERFSAGEDQRLKLQEIGPFTYLEYRLNEDLELKDGVMRYTPRLRSVFVLEDSIGHPEDINITMPNIPLLSAFTLLSTYPSYLRSLLSLIASQLQSKAIVSKTAQDYIWGYPDPILSLANNLAPGLIHFKTTGIMDRLYDKNTQYRLELGATDSDKFSVKTVKQSRTIQNGDQETVFESTANFTDTYEGIAYPPQLGPENPINIYRVGICKSFGMTACGTTTSEYGPQALVYRLKDELFRERTLCNSKGFCPNGLMDMGPCFLGLPLGMSKGHFLDGDPELLDRIEGLKPDRTIHQSHLTIEPKIGLTLETHLSLQVNIVLGDLSYDVEAKSFSDMVLPIAHFQIKQPRLPAIAVRALRLMYITMPKVFLAVQIILLSAGSLFLFYSMGLVYVLHLNKTAKSVSLDRTSNNNCLKAETPLIEKL